MWTITKLRFAVMLAIFPIAALASGDSSPRVESTASRMCCNCGCEEMLSECGHMLCKRKAALKGEIADAIAKGERDRAILGQMGGAAILAAPPFRGFNIVLWVFHS